MRSTFFGLEIARTGLFTAQNQMNITGHNISNVDTEGYTRQRLGTSAIPAQFEHTQFAVDYTSASGHGVTADTVEQIRSEFLDMEFRQENCDTNYWSTKEAEFEKVESLFNNMVDTASKSANIYNAMADFYTALSSLADNPSSKDVRTNLQQRAINLTETFNYAYEKIEEQHANINTSIEVTVGQVNDMCENLANINRVIYGAELTGAKANDLRDTRNSMLDTLSGIMDIEYSESSDGKMLVTLNGRALVDGAESFKLAVNPTGGKNMITGEYDQNTLCWADTEGNPSMGRLDQIQVSGGTLQAYFDMRDGNNETNIGLPKVAEDLNALVRKIVSEVNEVHRQGYTMPYLQEDSLDFTLTTVHLMDENGQAENNEDGTFAYVQPGNAFKATAPDGTEYFYSTNGVDFFHPGQTGDYSDINAGNFRISEEVFNNVYLIAASSQQVLVPNEGWTNRNELKGNAENLDKVMGLFNKEDAVGNPDNFNSVLSGAVVGVATEMEHILSMSDAQEVRLAAIDKQRNSVSGVSIDEEMTDMVRFTHAYNAAARVLTAIDEQIDTLVNKMGLVGR